VGPPESSQQHPEAPSCPLEAHPPAADAAAAAAAAGVGAVRPLPLLLLLLLLPLLPSWALLQGDAVGPCRLAQLHAHSRAQHNTQQQRYCMHSTTCITLQYFAACLRVRLWIHHRDSARMGLRSHQCFTHGLADQQDTPPPTPQTRTCVLTTPPTQTTRLTMCHLPHDCRVAGVDTRVSGATGHQVHGTHSTRRQLTRLQHDSA